MVSMKCPICRRALTRFNMAKDHCHKTGAWRDYICRNCNTGLGLFQDDPGIMRRAAKYIERNRVRPRLQTIRDSYALHPRA